MLGEQHIMGKWVRGMTMVLCLLSMVFVGTLQAYSQSGVDLRKESKKQAKRMTEEGWKVFGNAAGVKEALDAHYKTLEESNGSLMPLEARAKAKDLNLAVRKSRNSALRQYSSLMDTRVEAITQTQISASSDSAARSKIELNTNFRSTTSQNVRDFKPTAVFYREMDGGWIEVMSLYLVDAIN